MTHHSRETVLILIRPRFVIANVDAFFELTEEVRQKWMLDRQPARVGNQTLRGCIGAARRPVDQYVVPRLIAVWLCLVLGVPFLIGLTEVVAVNDNSPIAITPMVNQLAGFENRPDRIWRWTIDRNHGREGVEPLANFRMTKIERQEDRKVGPTS